MENFRAIVLGGTGLVGSELVRQLVVEPRCREVAVLGRRSLGVSDPKLREHVVDFDRPESWADHVRGDVLFSALGTTRKAAGSKAAQYTVDYTYQYDTADAASRNGVSTCVLVSAAGARPGALLFYSRMKGELEREVKALGFRRTVIVKPGLLAGERTEHRSGESFANAIARHAPSHRFFDRMRPYPAAVVARACIRGGLVDEPGCHVYALGEIFDRAGS